MTPTYTHTPLVHVPQCTPTHCTFPLGNMTLSAHIPHTQTANTLPHTCTCPHTPTENKTNIFFFHKTKIPEVLGQLSRDCPLKSVRRSGEKARPAGLVGPSSPPRQASPDPRHPSALGQRGPRSEASSSKIISSVQSHLLTEASPVQRSSRDQPPAAYVHRGAYLAQQAHLSQGETQPW